MRYSGQYRMPDSDVLASPRGPATPFLTSNKPLAFVRQRWDFLAVLLLTLASIPAAFLQPRTLVLVGDPAPLDDSWMLDIIFKASHGVWLGRDVAFTYGPLFQWLSSAPASWLGLTMGVIYGTHNALPLWCSFLFDWLSLCLLIPEQPPWKRFLLLLLLSVFWSPSDVRCSAIIFLFAVSIRSWSAVRHSSLKPALAGVIGSILCLGAFLVSADTGVHAVIALVVSLAAVGWDSRHDSPAIRRYAIVLVWFVICSTVLVLITNAIMSKPLDFGFWNTSFAIVSNYRWMEASQMAKEGKAHILAASLTGAVVFLIRGLTGRRQGSGITVQPSFLIGAFCFAVLAMQSGLVRSDMEHIAIAIFPMVFFIGTLLFACGSGALSTILVLTAMGGSWLLGGPSPLFSPGDIASRYSRAWRPVSECPVGMGEFSGACFPSSFTDVLRATAGYLQQQTGPRQPILVFPYQTLFGMAANREVAGGLMQTYLASGSYLSQLEIRGLERSSPPVGLFLPPGDLSDPIDGVSNFTRSPEVWFWIAQHYREDREVAPGVLGLVRIKDRPIRFDMVAQPIGPPSISYRIHKRSVRLDIGATGWPADGSDFLRLRLTIHYGVCLTLRKPQRLQLEMTRSDGSHELRSFVVPPNVSSDVWIFPWNEEGLAAYFLATEAQWRSNPRPSISYLRLWVSPLDWVSCVPESLDIEAVDAVRLRAK